MLGANIVSCSPFRQPTMAAESTLFLSEALVLISSTAILGILYGVIFILYVLCAWSLCLELQKPDKQRQARFSLGYVSFLFFCATGFLIVNTRSGQLVFINHADFPGGPLAYVILYNSTMDPYWTINGVLELIIEVFTMMIQVGHQSFWMKTL